ncbi:MAG: TonB-dependent receptor [Chloracidobacterium sp.]|uniref:TonB-dependent receptor n=1 Tax=Chloracidobacterium validum TaxID=2821543 RepID=A0ABX8BD14_9BACT|nr:TonB-dependent receptor [Chloracidobacterium validum]QUW03538.1 TonB-dependent receptor [Chloracidobacterium validum]
MLGLVLVGVAARAEERGTLVGQVRESQGAPVAEASVLARNLATGVVRSTLTAADGTFTVSDLPFGRYQVRITRDGFSDALVEAQLRTTSVTLDPVILVPGTIREVVTVTASRASRDTMTTPEVVSVVTERQLQERLPGTAADILRDLPGTSTQSQSFLTRPIIRGLEGNRVLVLVDGERLNHGRTPTSHVGNGVETGLVDVGTLEAVEVMRGAGSVLYGTEALGGTINFRTRPPATTDGGIRVSGVVDPFFTSNGPGGRYGGSLGFATRRLTVRARQSFENFSDYTSGGPVETGYASVTPQFNPVTRVVTGSTYRTNATRVEGRFFVTEQMFIRSSYERFRAAPYQYPLQGTFNFLFSNRDKVNAGLVVRELSPVVASIQVSGYYQWQQRRDQVTVRALPALFQVTDRQINPTTGGFDGQVVLTPWRNHVITAGVSFYRDTSADDRIVLRGTLPTPPGGLTPAQAQAQAAQIRTDPAALRALRAAQPRRDVPNANFQDVAFFAQDEVIVNRYVRLIGGLRMDHYRSRALDTPSYDIFNLVPPGTAGITGLASLRHANTALTGSGGIVVSPIQNISLVARLARSYREPNIFDRYNAGASHTISPTTRSVTIPNPDLKPETGVNLDVGCKVRFTRFAGSLTYFRNRYSNFISNFGAPVPGLAPIPNPIPGGAPLAVLQRQNLGQIRMQGIEADVEAPFRLPDALRSSFVTLLGNISTTRGDDLQTNQPVDPFNFPVVPVKAVVGMRWNSATNRYWLEYRSRIVTTQRRLPPGSLYAQPGTARLGFTVHDLRGGINLDRERYGVAVTLGIENLSNRFYQDLFSLFDAPARGRAFVAGVRFRFF